MRINTTSPKEWLDALKQHWDLSTTEMSDNEDYIVIMSFDKTMNKVVGYYSKLTKCGYVFTKEV